MIIFENRISRIAEQGRYVKLNKVLGSKLANPFQLPDVSGVQYYDNGVANGGHFLTLMSNVKITNLITFINVNFFYISF